MHWFEENRVFKEENESKLVYWKREMDDIFFIWRGSKDELEVFVWHLNGVEFKITFTLNHEKDNFIPFLAVGITKKANRLINRLPMYTYTGKQRIHSNT